MFDGDKYLSSLMVSIVGIGEPQQRLFLSYFSNTEEVKHTYEVTVRDKKVILTQKQTLRNNTLI